MLQRVFYRENFVCFCRTGIVSIRWIFLFARLNSISRFEKNVKQQGSGDVYVYL